MNYKSIVLTTLLVASSLLSVVADEEDNFATIRGENQIIKLSPVLQYIQGIVVSTSGAEPVVAESADIYYSWSSATLPYPNEGSAGTGTTYDYNTNRYLGMPTGVEQWTPDWVSDNGGYINTLKPVVGTNYVSRHDYAAFGESGHGNDIFSTAVTSLAVSVWAKPKNYQALGSIVSYDHPYPEVRSFSVQNQYIGESGWGFTMNLNVEGPRTLYIYPEVVYEDAWVHLGFIWAASNNTFTVYHNGASVTSTATTGLTMYNPDWTTNRLQIGLSETVDRASAVSPGTISSVLRFFNGGIDELKVWVNQDVGSSDMLTEFTNNVATHPTNATDNVVDIKYEMNDVTFPYPNDGGAGTDSIYSLAVSSAGTTPVYHNERFGVRLDGANDFMSAGTNESYFAGYVTSFTMYAWMKLDTITDIVQPIGYMRGINDGVFNSTSELIGMAMRSSGNLDTVVQQVDIGAANAGIDSVIMNNTPATTGIELYKWYHVGFSARNDTGEMKVYVNGQQVDSKVDASIIGRSISTYRYPKVTTDLLTSRMHIGVDSGGANRYFDGFLDDWGMIVNQAWGDAEFLAEYNATAGDHPDAYMHYDFETAGSPSTNSSGAWDALTVVNADHVVVTNDVTTGAYYLDSTNSYLVTTNEIVNPNAAPYPTVMGWFKFDDFVGQYPLFAMGTNTGQGSILQVYTLAGSNTLNVGVSGHTSLYYDQPLPSNEWVHVAVVQRGVSSTTLDTYINGIQTITSGYSGYADRNIAIDDSTFKVGALASAYTNTFKGFTDDVRLYYRPLTSNEIYNIATDASTLEKYFVGIPQLQFDFTEGSFPYANKGTLGSDPKYDMDTNRYTSITGAGVDWNPDNETTTAGASYIDTHPPQAGVTNNKTYHHWAGIAEVGYDNDLFETAYTSVAWSMWVKPEMLHAFNNVFSVDRATGNTRLLEALFDGMGGWFSPGGNGGSVAVAALFNLSGGNKIPTHTIDGFAGGEWHHLGAIYDGATAQIYWDGDMKDSVAATGTLSTNDASTVRFNIGHMTYSDVTDPANDVNYGRFYHGGIGGMKFWFNKNITGEFMTNTYLEGLADFPFVANTTNVIEVRYNFDTNTLPYPNDGASGSGNGMYDFTSISAGNDGVWDSATNGYRFDGVNDVMLVGTNTSWFGQVQTAMTMAVWFKADDFEDVVQPLGYFRGLSANTWDSRGTVFGMELNSSGNIIGRVSTLALGQSGGNNESMTVNVAGLVSTGVWHHAALTAENETGSLVLYLDGQPIATNINTDVIGNSFINWRYPPNTYVYDGRLVLAKDTLEANRQFDGLMDDFVFTINRAWSAVEVEAEYDATSGTDHSN